MSEPFSPAQLAQIATVVKAAVREEFADVGLRIDEADHVDEARKDFLFTRSLRLGVNGVAGKIGWFVIAAFLGGVVWLVQAGLTAWKAMP